MEMTLTGKRIIVTGAATGIGRATASLVAARGAVVALFDVNDGSMAEVVTAVTAAGGRARAWHVDVSAEDQVRVAVAEATDWLGGGPDVLLHLAGILQGARVDIAEFTESTWDAVIDVNLKGSFLVSKHVAARMQQGGGGVIVLTSSIAGVTHPSSSYAYGSSKGGVHGLAITMRGALADRGIRVNDVCPTAVDTPLKVAAVEEIYRRTGDRAAFDRDMATLVRPEGIANVMAWLASDDAADVTGTIFTR
jgi:NAD(P)-dependent dehydrogenase (short-subunit alcohol dehydrogenase family)